MNLFTYSAKSFRHHMGAGVIVIIALAIALCSTVLGIMTSIQKSIYDQAVSVSRNFHVGYNFLTEEQVALIAADPRVEWVDERLVLREYGLLPSPEEFLSLLTSSGFRYSEGESLQWGHMPEKNQEIVLSPPTAKALGLQGIPGEVFTLTTNTPQGHQNRYSMTLTGLLSETTTSELYFGRYAFISEAFAREHGQFGTAYREAASIGSTLNYRTLYVHFKDHVPVRETAAELGAAAGVTEEEDISVNEGYLQASINDPGTLLVVILALGILTATGIMMIHSAFGIIVVKRSRQLGLLRLVGASKGQLVSCVLWEGFFSLLAALPLGILFGVGLTYLGLPTCALLLGDFAPISFSMPLWVYGATALLALFMVLLGALAPARRAGQTTPVQAVQFSAPEETARKRKFSEDISLSRLAEINMDRSRSRSRSILAALSVSGVLFIGMFTVGGSMLDSVDVLVRRSSPGDFAVYSGHKEGNGYSFNGTYQLTEPLLAQISAMDGVTRTDAFRSQNYCDAALGDEERPGQVGTVVAVSETFLKEILASISGAPSIERFRSAGAALALNGNDKYTAPYSVNPGDSKSILPMKNLVPEERALTLDVLAVGSRDAFPMPLPFGGALPTLVMLESTYAAMGFAPDYTGASLTVDEARQEEIDAALTELLAPYDQLYLESAFLKRQEMTRQMMGVLVLVFLIVFLVAVIGVLNLVSATCISMEQRQREFGILYALGLGKKGIRRLLYRESLVLSLRSVLLAGTLGLAAGSLLFFLLHSAGSDYLRFSFPLLPLLGVCLVYGLAPRVTTYFASRRLLRQPPAELLRKEE